MELAKIGAWAFLIGIVIAIIAGLAGSMLAGMLPMIMAILVLLGIIIGFLNVTEKETHQFLVAAVAIVIVSFMGGNVFMALDATGFSLGTMIGSMLQNIMALVIPAVIIVALKQVIAIAKDQ
jgi:hypothetical protein